MSQINKSNFDGWRSVESLENDPKAVSFEHREFQEGASEATSMTRRSFVKLMGASVALAGVAGCSIRKPKQQVLPYAKRPEDLVPGQARYFATAIQVGEDVTGVLAETYSGRPTKLEGNPSHPSSQGALNAHVQASILDLYDPDRVIFPKQNGDRRSWDDFDAWLSGKVGQFASTSGKGVCILTEGQLSPSFYRLVDGVKRRYPKSMMLRYDGVNRDNIVEGLKSATGKMVLPDYRFELADVIVSLDSDFLGTEPSSLRYSKAFSTRRDPDKRSKMSRLYSFENQFSVTGTKADHHFSMKASDVEGVAWLLADRILKRVGTENQTTELRRLIARGAAQASSLLDAEIVDAVATDLLNARGRGAILAGRKQPASLHALVHLLNTVLGNVGNAVVYRPLPYSNYSMNQSSNQKSIESLKTLLRNQDVDTLFILGGNPLYHASSDEELSSLLANAKDIVHLTVSENDTSARASWVLPEAHFLESWGDLKGADGTISLVQPTIQPLYNGRSVVEFLSNLLGRTDSAYAIVRRTWRSVVGAAGFESSWKKWLHNGFIRLASRPLSSLAVLPGNVSLLLTKAIKREFKTSDIELVLSPSYTLYDGRFANNGWLQELPDPVSKLTWENAAMISEALAKRLAVKSGQLVTLVTDASSVDVPVMIMPGHADNSVSLSLGFGRDVVGRVGEGSGVNAFKLQSKGSYLAIIQSISAQNKVIELASTQNHGSMEGRPLYREASLDFYKKHPKFAQQMVKMPHVVDSLFEERKYDTGYQWGMVIDLSKCTGCNACVTACQAENNIPIVGREEVLKGREMHWIRIDRYFVGDPNNVATVYQQPVTCLHCENAPCEQVCPVAATVHSHEGTNDMVYNRCIGTRYCSNNCPVKVRRFNFFDYHQKNPQAVKKKREHLFDYFKEPDPMVQRQFNPNVTVRMRGVMEKCTFCIQRVNEARVRAKNESRKIRDGEVLSACQQTCPSDAIVFGDINDPKSKVSRLKKKYRDYGILDELYLKARTTYLASVRNPNPKLAKFDVIPDPVVYEDAHDSHESDKSHGSHEKHSKISEHHVEKESGHGH